MADPSPRRVRLPRSEAAAPVRGDAPPVEGPTVRRLPNRAATQRARRITMIYVVALAALYLAFAVIARGSVGGASSGTAQDLELFGWVASVLAFVGALLTLLSAPAALEISPDVTVVVNALGVRRRYPAGPGLLIRVRRRYPAGLLSGEPVESVEVSSGAVLRTYLVDAGALRETAPRSG